MVQIFVYFEHMQIVRKLEPTKIFAQDYDITRLFLAWQLFVYYIAPDVSGNMVATYHHLDGERSMHHESNSSNQPNVCPRGCGLKNQGNSKIRTSKFYSNRKFEIIRKYALMKISRYTVIHHTGGSRWRNLYMYFLLYLHVHVHS